MISRELNEINIAKKNVQNQRLNIGYEDRHANCNKYAIRHATTHKNTFT